MSRRDAAALRVNLEDGSLAIIGWLTILVPKQFASERGAIVPIPMVGHSLARGSALSLFALVALFATQGMAGSASGTTCRIATP